MTGTRQVQESKRLGTGPKAWSLAKVLANAEVAREVAVVAESRLPELQPQHLANVAWAMAKLTAGSHSAYARASLQHQFKPQEACNLLWAFATASVDVGEASIAKSVAQLSTGLLSQLTRCNPQDHANFLWSMVTLTAAERQTVAHISESALRKLEQFDATQLSALLWAVAKSGYEPSSDLFQAASRLEKNHTLGAQHLANLLWSFAVAQQSPELVQGLSAKAAERAEEFRAQELTGMLWAMEPWPVLHAQRWPVSAPQSWPRSAPRWPGFSKMQLGSTALARSAPPSLRRDSVPALSSEELVTTAWALAQGKKQGLESGPLAAAVAAACVAGLSSGQLCRALGALARLVPSSLVSPLLQELQQRPLPPAALVEVLSAAMRASLLEADLLQRARSLFAPGAASLSATQLARVALAAGYFAWPSLATSALEGAAARLGRGEGLEAVELAHLGFGAALCSLMDRPLQPTRQVLGAVFRHPWEAAGTTQLLAERSQVYTAHLAACWLCDDDSLRLSKQAAGACEASARIQSQQSEELPTAAYEVGSALAFRGVDISYEVLVAGLSVDILIRTPRRKANVAKSALCAAGSVTLKKIVQKFSLQNHLGAQQVLARQRQLGRTNWRRALAVFARARAQQLQLSDLHYAAAMRACQRGGEPTAAMRLFAEIEEPSTRTLTAAIASCGPRDWELAVALLGAMEFPDLAAYSACLKVLKAKPSRALRLLDTLRRQQLSPDLVCYSAVISACGQGRFWLKALACLRHLDQDAVAPNVVAYSAAISACEKALQWEQGLFLLREMAERGIKPNVVSHSAVLTACDKARQWQWTLHHWKEMRAAGVAPNRVSYTAAIGSTAWDAMLEMLEASGIRRV
ncbi:unnamed protein product [Effrenium voratum]|nr:unnamed protein product [Effrenium voratum]